MIKPITLAVVESNSGTRNDIAAIIRTLGERVAIVASVTEFSEGMKAVQAVRPEVVVLEVKDVERGVEETGLILSRFPGTMVFVTSTAKNPDWILRLIRAGASEYLTKPIVASELTEAVKKVARQLVQAKGGSIKEGNATAVYHPGGGMGTTTIAVNLAATLAAEGKKVALMDLNFLCGDVTAFLDLNPRYTLANVAANAERLDASFLMSVMAGHRSGIDILSGPKDIDEASRITPEQIQEVLGVMKTVYEHIIIDTGGPLFGCNQATFANCDHVLFATVLSLPAIKNARRYLPLMNNYGQDSVKLVINRHTSKDDIRVSDAQKILNTKAFMMIPNNYCDVMGSINKGMPVISCYPKSPVTKAMGELARLLTLENSSLKTPPQRNTFYDAFPAIQFGSPATR